MFRIVSLISLLLLFASAVNGAQSIITDSEGSACLSQGKTKTQVESEARLNAEQKAREVTLQHLKDQGHSDWLSSYQKATVKTIGQTSGVWSTEASQQCFTVGIRAEVIPEAAPVKTATRGIKVVETSGPPAPVSSSAQLQVQVWTDKTAYRQGDKMKIFLRGNKAFYARVVYKDAGGNLIQLLPNPYRQNNYFDGSATYEIPSGQDRFDLEVTPPFGNEEIIVYGSSAPLGELDVRPSGGIYELKVEYTEVGIRTRGFGGTRASAASKPITSMNTAARPGVEMRPTSIAQNSRPEQSTQNKAFAEFSEMSVVTKTTK